MKNNFSALDLVQEESTNKTEISQVSQKKTISEKCPTESNSKDDSGESDVNIKNNKSLEFFRSNSRNYVRCKECLKFPELVKLNTKNKKAPAISMPSGTQYRANIVKDHLVSKVHTECHKAFMQSQIDSSQILTSTPIGISIYKANVQLANHIGKLMLIAYSSCKKLTLSANTFPARVFVGNAAENFNFDNFKINKSAFNFNYVSPAAHKDFLETIVESHRADLAKQITSSLAVSIRSDGSVDRVQIDKIYTMAKAISDQGVEKNYFLGAAEPTERGANGLLGALKKGCQATVGSSAANDIFKITSSIVTDGTNANIGEKAGLWKILDDYIKSLNPEAVQPLLKIWCGAHR